MRPCFAEEILEEYAGVLVPKFAFPADETCVHAVAVEFDFMQPFRAFPVPPARTESVAAGSIPAKWRRSAALPIAP